MSKYIDKDRVLEYIIFGVVGKDITCGELKRAIESLPTIEVSEDAISREQALDEFKKNYGDIVSLKIAIEELPSVVPSRAEGVWITEEKDSIYGKKIRLTCSECGDVFDVTEAARPYERYCRYCGAKMKG